jgi:NAD(P)H dehydrogenase (quinone)
MKVYVVFYSSFGHIYRMAEAIAEGAREVEDAEVSLFRVPELIPEEVLVASGMKEAQKSFAQVPIIQPKQLADCDAVIFGTPTRYGNMASQMRNFIDQTGQLWMKGSTIGKVASVFASSATQHGGQESTILSFHTTLFHLGYVVVGLPYSEKGLHEFREVSGGTPYGATTIAGGDGSRMPSEAELTMARSQGRHVAQLTRELVIGRQYLTGGITNETRAKQQVQTRTPPPH